MSTRFGADDGEPLEPRDLAEFEVELRHVLEQRLVQAAQSPRQPTNEEARQLARMVAHMDVSDLAGRARTMGPVHQPVEAAHAASGRAQPHGALGLGAPTDDDVLARAADPGNSAPMSTSPSATWRPRHGQRNALLRLYGPLAAVVLGVALVRTFATGPSPVAPPTVDLGARAPAPVGAPPTNDVYLSADQRPGVASSEFTGRVTWDLRGQDGVVLVAVFDRTDDQVRALSEELVLGSEWTPSERLPKRFRVVVDRPADDGLGREELHWAEYFMP